MDTLRALYPHIRPVVLESALVASQGDMEFTTETLKQWFGPPNQNAREKTVPQTSPRQDNGRGGVTRIGSKRTEAEKEIPEIDELLAFFFQEPWAIVDSPPNREDEKFEWLSYFDCRSLSQWLLLRFGYDSFQINPV